WPALFRRWRRRSAAGGSRPDVSDRAGGAQGALLREPPDLRMPRHRPGEGHRRTRARLLHLVRMQSALRRAVGGEGQGAVKICDVLRFAGERGEPVFSFEFFPPKTEAGVEALFETVKKLHPLAPAFVSVT